jgi:hypothetical protein
MARQPNHGRNRHRRGGALLTVLWLSIALATIAFAVASRVRAESERSITLTEGMRAHYLAEGAIHRATIAFLQRQIISPATQRLDFPDGTALLEVVPEASRLNINRAQPEELVRLLLALGAAPAMANEIAAAIVDWRTPAGGPGAVTPFDSYYLQQRPSFRARHASIEEVEELLFVRGMTPELFYGTWVRDTNPQSGGRLVALGGLRDCVSTRGSLGVFDVSGMEPALLLALGAPPAGVEQYRRLRLARPLTANDMEQIRPLLGPAGAFLRFGGNTTFTFRATAFPRNSSARRTIEATVKYFNRPVDMPYHVVRWRETANSDFTQWEPQRWQ